MLNHRAVALVAGTLLRALNDGTTAAEPPLLSGRAWVAIVTGLACCGAGTLLVVGGGWLAVLGGSWFYLLAGAGLIGAGVLMIRRNQASLAVYGAVLVATLIWALSEVGLDWWPLAARGDVLYPLGVWMLTPFVGASLDPKRAGIPLRITGLLWVGVIAGGLVLVASLAAPDRDTRGVIPPGPAGTSAVSGDQPDSDWRAYGRTSGGERYSPLAQITPANVSHLKVAWVFRTGDGARPGDPFEVTFEATPLKVGETLYLCSQHQRLFAIDAATGRLRWSYDPQLRSEFSLSHMTCRGVAYHETRPGDLASDGRPAPQDCPQELFLPVNDGRLIAIDARTGRPCVSFGDHGTLDLKQGLGLGESIDYVPTSPPLVTDKLLVIGAAVSEGSSLSPSGVVRAFDIHTGKLVWAWDPGAPDATANEVDPHAYSAGSPTDWMIGAYDPALRMVYLPMGNPHPQTWGGHRTPLSERFADALVALDANTGRRIWSYQTVHHDLWDLDIPAQPTLVDLRTATGVVPAIVQPTKTGDIFVLDRRTGRPIVPAPERPAPQGAAPGDRLSPTQPFSALSFRPRRRLTPADMWGATIFDQLFCRIRFQGLRYDGPFTPPSTGRGSLAFPGNEGVFEWGGLAVDPVRQIAIANPNAMMFLSRLTPRPPAERVGGHDAPFGADIEVLITPKLHLPCLRPPWGYMAGIDLRTMKVVWQHKNGTTRDDNSLGLAFKMGVPSLGGPLATAGGVAFLTSSHDDYIRAYDVRDGRQLWEDRLPAGGQSTPMSYEVGGTQYVVTADGGHGAFVTKPGDYVVAYRLAK